METLSREELIKLVDRAHKDSTYGDSTQTGKTLAEHSKLPTLVAQNLGAGFGQWDFFPEIGDIVDFALGYVPPSNEAELFALAQTWASDDANKRHTILALVGRDVLKQESRRLEVASLRELFEETRGSREREMRKTLGLEVCADKAGPPSKTGGAPREPRAPKAAKAEFQIPDKMPKPSRIPVKKKEAAPPPRKFGHPKFGEGFLERIEGAGDSTKLTIKFASGSKTLLAHFVTEIPS